MTTAPLIHKLMGFWNLRCTRSRVLASISRGSEHWEKVTCPRCLELKPRGKRPMTATTWKGRTLYLGEGSSGIDVQYRKGRRVLAIGGWFDGSVGIESREIALGEFLKGLGITLKDCQDSLGPGP